MNDSEAEEKCTKHKLAIEAVCLTCDSVKCCYKCFSVSNNHYNHNSCFFNETDTISSTNWELIEESSSSTQIFGQFPSEKQPKEKKKAVNRQIASSENDRSTKMKSQMKSYRLQIDDLCKQITEQVWNYRSKFIQYMDSKLSEYNAFILVEQGSQLNSEMIQMRNELENFINSLKNQIQTIDSQNGQKNTQKGQLIPCNCLSGAAGANCFNINSNTIYTISNTTDSRISNNNNNCYGGTNSTISNNYNNNNNIMNDFNTYNNMNSTIEDDFTSNLQNQSPSCYSCSCNSSASYSSSPQSYSYSPPYYQTNNNNNYNQNNFNNTYQQCLGGINCPNNFKNNNEVASAFPSNSYHSNQQCQFGSDQQIKNWWTDSQQQNSQRQQFENSQQGHLESCPNYFIILQQKNSNSQGQMSLQASISFQQNSQQQQNLVVNNPKQISQIFVILTNGKSLPLQFNIYSSVLQIKILIFEKTGVPPLEQKLFFYTKELHNYMAMKDYGIPRDCSIKLYIRSFYSQLQSIYKKQKCSQTALPLEINRQKQQQQQQQEEQSYQNNNQQFQQQTYSAQSSSTSSHFSSLVFKTQKHYENNQNLYYQYGTNENYQNNAALTPTYLHNNIMISENEQESDSRVVPQGYVNSNNNIYEKNVMQEDNYSANTQNIFICS